MDSYFDQIKKMGRNPRFKRRTKEKRGSMFPAYRFYFFVLWQNLNVIQGPRFGAYDMLSRSARIVPGFERLVIGNLKILPSVATFTSISLPLPKKLFSSFHASLRFRPSHLHHHARSIRIYRLFFLPFFIANILMNGTFLIPLIINQLWKRLM